MTPLERAAKAFCDGTAGTLSDPSKGWARETPEVKEFVMVGMRAALATLMEPGEEALKAGSTEIDPHVMSVVANIPLAKVMWQAMLKKVIE